MTAGAGLFGRYPNEIFVETGAFEGDGIAAALEAGFPQVISIEKDPAYTARCEGRFVGDHRVKLVQGDSAQCLGDVLSQLAAPATIWLDAHCYNPKLPKFNSRNCPLRDELAAISRVGGRRHTILIDDLFCCETSTFGGLRFDQIVRDLLAINPNFCMRLEEGAMAHDVLAAWPPG